VACWVSFLWAGLVVPMYLGAPTLFLINLLLLIKKKKKTAIQLSLSGDFLDLFFPSN
jgi:hypothetical protein